ncbi:helix-turn-helix domain-containing protein [Nocardioides sp.]|uniref:AraC-like ligand-binding domain-containing protein n=1 Tax=Nocardioides sp. TaxID=35761 RepID=UPI0027192CF6|nr:helix-turn-helix domain-containing protein [Nocardioides sp.]MDO9457391.1 helix-turn-helix domain-containing protein [Nocardioides sp.]
MTNDAGLVARDDADNKATWASMLREHFVALDVVESPTDGFHGDVSSWSLGHLSLARVRSLPQVIDRSTSLVRSDHRAYLQVGLMRAGHAVVQQDGREAVLGPGDFVVYETTRPFTWSLRPEPDAPIWQLDVFTWPRASIRICESDSHLVTATTMDGSSGLTAILSRMLRDLMVERPVVATPQSAALADEIGNLLTVVTSSVATPEERHPDATLVSRIERYIDEHLDDPDLAPETIARAHAVSLRQLHRLFAARQHTVSRTIRTRRLEMCRRELVAPSSVGRTVSEIGRRWGFPDLGVFGRAFRETYGVSPRAYRSGGGPLPTRWSED